MSIEQENLDRYYQSTLATKNDKAFFLCLTDYVQYIQDTPVTKELFEQFNKERAKAEEKVNKLDQQIVKEVKKAKKEIDQIIKSNKISSPELDKLYFNYDNWEQGKSAGSESYGNNLYNALADIIRTLRIDFREKVQHFESEKKTNRPITHEFNFAPSLYAYSDAKEHLSYQQKTEVWGGWNSLALIHLIIYSGDDYLAKLREEGGVNGSKDIKKWWEALNFSFVLGEAKHVLEGRNNEREIHALFDRPEVEEGLIRIHNDLMKNLSLSPTEKNTLNFAKSPNLKGEVSIPKVAEYMMTFSNNQLMVNNRFTLAKNMHFNGQVEKVITYIFNHQNEKITKGDIENYWKIKITRKFSKILNDLGISKEIKKAFFPKLSEKNGMLFRNPVALQQLKDENIDENSLEKKLDYEHTRNTLTIPKFG